MANLSIPEKLNPGDTINLGLSVVLFGESLSWEFSNIKIPKSPPLMSKVDGIKLIVEDKDTSITSGNKSFNFTKFSVMSNISQNRYRLLLFLQNNKNIGELNPRDNVLITIPTNTSHTLHNAEGEVLNIKTGKKNYVNISLPISKKPNGTAPNGSQIAGAVTEVKKKIQVRSITISYPKAVLDQMVSEISGKSPKSGDIEDIPVFAYKQFNGENKASIKYKLMIDDSEINLKKPPQRSDVFADRGKLSRKKDFTINDDKGNKVLCYVAIARYTYDGDKWEGEWLQVNKEKEVIWGRAK